MTVADLGNYAKFVTHEREYAMVKAQKQTIFSIHF